MMNKKSTKKALLMSALSLLLCMSMLIGTTFAWFTDEVNSGVNKIYAGNLDVEVVNKDNESIEKVTLFDGILWEPGVVAYENITVQNLGTLALKYSLYINFANENYVKLADGTLTNYGLASALKVAIVDEAITETDRDKLVASIADSEWTSLANLVELGNLYPVDNTEGKASEQAYGIVIWWEPGENDNNWNVHNGKSTTDGQPLHIDLGIKLTATQLMAEQDSFGPDYDDEAHIPVANVNPGNYTAIDATLGMGGVDYPVTLDTSFVFKTTESYEQAQLSGYRYWHADFVVSVDKDVAPMGIALAGYYAAYCDDYNDGKWVALASDETITANTEIRLLELMLNGGSMSYEELCNWVPEFLCGVADLDGNNAGTTLTVELRLYEVEDNTASTADETGEYITIGTYTYTFPEEVSDSDDLDDVLQGDDENIVVNLTEDVTYDIGAWNSESMGGANTKTITINGNGHTITFNKINSDWTNIVTNGAKLIINNATITDSGYDATSGTWNGHDITFNCDVELNNVISLSAIAVEKNATFNNVQITDDSTDDAYMLWICANGQTVTLNNCTIDATGTDGSDRGIKIDDQYVGAPAKVTLNVTGTKIVSEKKAAILVKSSAGAEISLSQVDISGVAADTTNAVWVDSDAEEYANLVTVTGGTVIVEP